MLANIKTSSLVKTAIGILITGTGTLYCLNKSMQYKVRSLPHYKETFEILAKHKDVQSFVGVPLQIGNVDLSNRLSNFVGDFESKLRIPIAGNLNGGFLNIVAKRKSKDDIFSICTIELELEDGSDKFLIYDKNRKLTVPEEPQLSILSRAYNYFFV